MRLRALGQFHAWCPEPDLSLLSQLLLQLLTQGGEQAVVQLRLRGGVPHRIGRFDSPWGETLVCWRQEGLSEGEDIAQSFGFDLELVSGLDLSSGFPVQTVS